MELVVPAFLTPSPMCGEEVFGGRTSAFLISEHNSAAECRDQASGVFNATGSKGRGDNLARSDAHDRLRGGKTSSTEKVDGRFLAHIAIIA